MDRFKSCLDSNGEPTCSQAEDMDKTFDVSFAGLNKSATLREIVDTLRCLVAGSIIQERSSSLALPCIWQLAVGNSQHSTCQRIHYLNENLAFLVLTLNSPPRLLHLNYLQQLDMRSIGIESDQGHVYCNSIGVEYMHIGDLQKLDWIRTRVESPDFLPSDKEKLIKIYSHAIEIPKNAVEKKQ